MSQKTKVFDVIVIGGGINGTGIAADAAGRGLDVALVEMNDLASATSSASTKLIHGGLRYLEHYEFNLVRKSLLEREVLLANAPHIVQPLCFRLPHHKHLRPKWIIRLGLYLYDLLGKRVTLPRSTAITFGDNEPLVKELKNGFEYYDARVDDSRLVILNARQAQDKGASIFTHMECIEALSDEGIWKLGLIDHQNGQNIELRTRVVVNATGPWVSKLMFNVFNKTRTPQVRLVKGCHIIVRKIYPGSQAYILQNGDGRVIFVIPYQQQFTLIGTTEEDIHGKPEGSRISSKEINYLIDVVNANFKNKLDSSCVVHHFSGVRPLMEGESVANGTTKKTSEISRDYVLDLNTEQAPLLSVYGGKITTYRLLAEDVMDKLRSIFPDLAQPWTETATLPGGQFVSIDVLSTELKAHYPWLADNLIDRWVNAYGSLTTELLGSSSGHTDLGRFFGHTLYQLEVDYLRNSEWATTVEDILWRRTKLGLLFSEDESGNLQQYLDGSVSAELLKNAG